MLSLFPELFFLAPFSAFLIRLALSAVLLLAATYHWSYADGKAPGISTRFLGLFEGAMALLFIVGMYTQGAALAVFAITLLWLFSRPLRPFAKSTLFLVLALCISLLITGAGAFAFDLPL
jgi:hypothetical protein